MAGGAATNRSNDHGFTLVEILIAIVLVGILAAVVVVGIGKLTERASAASCAASADAARTSVQTYLVSTTAYPSTFADLTRTAGSVGPALVVPATATIDGRNITLGNWRLTMSTTTPPTFTCSVIAIATVVADATNPNGWSFVNDNGQGGGGGWVAGPAPTPLGSGSAQLSITGSLDGQIVTSSVFASTRLDKITALTYSSFQPAGSFAPVIAFDVRYRPTDTAYGGRLVFTQNGTAASTIPGWRSWAPLDGTWYASKNTPAPGSNGLCVQSTSPCTWAQILQAFPDATIGGGLVFKAGSGWVAATFAVDNLVIGIADPTGRITETTYDFGG